MTDETRPDEPGTSAATLPTDGDQKGPIKLTQTVEMTEIGPCKKHIKITVARKDIDDRLGEKFKDLVSESYVAGFRPGKAPRKLVEKRFFKDVSEQVKTEILMASLEQLAEENDVAPLGPPNIDPNRLEIPKDGPFVYEFDVEVRPQFDLPNYKGLTIERPVHTFTPEEIAQEERRVLAPDGQVIPKPEGNAQVGDILVADVVVRHGERLLGDMKEQTFTVDRRLAFRDGIADNFAEQVAGANAGDEKMVDVTLSQSVADATLRGQVVKAAFKIKEVKALRLPELNAEYLGKYGIETAGQFRELIEVVLQRRLDYLQRQSARKQIIQQIAASANWQLPEDLLARQARRAINRRIMEMKADGLSEEEIGRRIRLLQQDILQSTALALKEHFVLQKIAEEEKIDVNEDEVNEEIERIASQNDESPRRLRARLERDDLLEALMIEMIERKVLDLILDKATYTEVPLEGDEKEHAVSTIEAQAVPGQMQDPSQNPPAEGGETSTIPS